MLFEKDRLSNFFEALQEQPRPAERQPVEGLFLMGYAKIGVSDDVIMYSRNLLSNNWTSIPISLVESVEIVGELPISDAVFKVVEIALRKPDNEYESLLVSLVAEQDSWASNDLHSHDENQELKSSEPEPQLVQTVEHQAEQSGELDDATAFMLAAWPPGRLKPPRWLQPPKSPSIPQPPVIRPPIEGFPWSPLRISRYSKCAKCKFWIDAAITAATLAAGGTPNVDQLVNELAKGMSKELAKRVALGIVQKVAKDSLITMACKEMGNC